MNRRQAITAGLAGAGTYATLGASGCSTSVISVATGLLDAASAAINILANGGVFPPADRPWVLAASKFVTDAVTELTSTDATATKIATILTDFSTDFQGLPLPLNTNIYLTAAALAIEAFVAFLQSQKAAVDVALAMNVPSAMISMAGTLSSGDKATLKKITATQKTFAAKVAK